MLNFSNILKLNELKSDKSHNLLSSEIIIQMKGNREAVIEGCKGVAECDENRIAINLKRNKIYFHGKNISITNMENEKVEIEGYFTSVSFE